MYFRTLGPFALHTYTIPVGNLFHKWSCTTEPMPNSHLAGEAINLKNQNLKSHDKYTYIAGAQLNLQNACEPMGSSIRKMTLIISQLFVYKTHITMHMVESTFLYISYRSNMCNWITYIPMVWLDGLHAFHTLNTKDKLSSEFFPPFLSTFSFPTMVVVCMLVMS